MVPQGRWSFHDFLDSDGGAEQRPFRVELELSRTGDHVCLDGSRSDDQARGPINYTTNAGLLRIAFGRYLQSLDADLDVNEGLLRNLDEWIAREGSILKPRFPAPLGMRANTRFRVMSCIFGSLAQANGGSVPAGSPVYVLYYFRSWDEARRRPILCIEGLGVGLGRGRSPTGWTSSTTSPRRTIPSSTSSGISRCAWSATPRARTPADPGLHRGGCGVVRDVRVLAEKAELATRMENTVVAPYGVAGGRAGRTGRIILNPGTPEERELVALGDGIVLKRGDLLRFETCGGGGWGDPLERDPERVRTDVARGFITARGAFEDYGVALDPATLDLDKTATDEERRRRARDLPLIDRGPGFEGSGSPLAHLQSLASLAPEGGEGRVRGSKNV